MAGPDRKRGMLTVSDRDYLSGRTNLQAGSERNARNRIRRRAQNSLYDFEYLLNELEDRDVTHIASDSNDADEAIFDAVEQMIGFVFRLCERAPDVRGGSTNQRFKDLVENGVEKGLVDDDQLLHFDMNLEYGVPRERKNALMRKVRDGRTLTTEEMREAVENEYFGDSLYYKPVGKDGLPLRVDGMDVVSHDDLRD